MRVQLGGNTVAIQVRSSGVARASALIRDGLASLVEIGSLTDSDGNPFNPGNGVQTFTQDDAGRVTEIISTQTAGVWVQTLTWTDGVTVPEISMWVKQ